MKKIIKKLVFCLLLVFVAFVADSSAEDFPASPTPSRVEHTARNNAPNEPFYGYVPPPPIRHTWPGGYKVIFHELLDTLAEHMLGRY